MVQSYILCTAPRSGSTLLCSLLTASGVAGRPASYFHSSPVTDWTAELGLALSLQATDREHLNAAIAEALRQGRAGTGIFALRQQANGRAYLCQQLALLAPQETTDAGRIGAVFGRTLYVHLTRADKVDQAVSLTLARQTGLWHRAPDGSELERNAPHLPPRYDADDIRAAIADLTAQDQGWTDWFAREGITPLRLTYAELSADPVRTLRRVLDHLGLDPAAAAAVTPGTRKLADAINREWIARFHHDSEG